MTYRLDDEGAFADAVVDAGNEAYGACVRAGQHCAHQMSGGVFSRAVALSIAPERVWTKALEHGLVSRLEKGAYQLCALLFAQWNPTAEKARALRDKRSMVGQLGGKASANARANREPTGQPFASPFAQPKSNPQGVRGMGSGSAPESDPDPTSHHATPGGGDLPNAAKMTQPDETIQVTTDRQNARRTYPPAAESGFDLAERVWLELWQAKYRRKFLRTTTMGDKGQDRILQRIGHLAFEQERPEASVRHWVKSYLRDTDNWVMANEHPLAGLEPRLNKYGEPKGPPRSGVRPVASQMPAEHPPAILDMAELSKRATALANLGKATG